MFDFLKKKIVSECGLHCPKSNACQKWVVLWQTSDVNGEKKTVAVGKCAFAWIPSLMVELAKKG